MAKKKKKNENNMAITFTLPSDLHTSFVEAARKYGNMKVTTWVRMVCAEKVKEQRDNDA